MKTIDRTGQKYNLLTFVSMTDKKNSMGRTLWLLDCECGNTVEIIADSVVSGSTKSCGCLLRGEYKTLMLWAGGRDITDEEIIDAVAKSGSISETLDELGIDISHFGRRRCYSPRQKDWAGQKFYYLTMISIAEKSDSGRDTLWNAMCDCGASIIVIPRFVASGDKQSCGCKEKRMKLTKEAKERHKIWMGNAPPEYHMLKRARARATKFNIPFNIEEGDIIIPKFCPILEKIVSLQKFTSTVATT